MKKFIAIILSMTVLSVTLPAQDTLRQKDNTRIQKRDRIHQEDHLLFQEGKLYRVQQGMRTQVQDPVTLRNGTVVNPNGSFQMKNQEQVQLRNGECMDMDGNRYQSKRMFNQNRMMTKRQIERGRNKSSTNNGMRSQQNRRKGRTS